MLNNVTATRSLINEENYFLDVLDMFSQVEPLLLCGGGTLGSGNSFLSPKSLSSRDGLIKTEWSIGNVTAVGSPARAENVFWRDFDLFWPIQAVFVAR